MEEIYAVRQHSTRLVEVPLQVHGGVGKGGHFISRNWRNPQVQRLTYPHRRPGYIYLPFTHTHTPDLPVCSQQTTQGRRGCNWWKKRVVTLPLACWVSVCLRDSVTARSVFSLPLFLSNVAQGSQLGGPLPCARTAKGKWQVKQATPDPVCDSATARQDGPVRQAAQLTLALPGRLPVADQ